LLNHKLMRKALATSKRSLDLVSIIAT